MNFYEKANWKAIEELMVTAGLLTNTGHDVERTTKQMLGNLLECWGNWI